MDDPTPKGPHKGEGARTVTAQAAERHAGARQLARRLKQNRSAIAAVAVEHRFQLDINELAMRRVVPLTRRQHRARLVGGCRLHPPLFRAGDAHGGVERFEFRLSSLAGGHGASLRACLGAAAVANHFMQLFYPKFGLRNKAATPQPARLHPARKTRYDDRSLSFGILRS